MGWRRYARKAFVWLIAPLAVISIIALSAVPLQRKLDALQRQVIFNVVRAQSAPGSVASSLVDVWIPVPAAGEYPAGVIHGRWWRNPGREAPAILYLHSAGTDLEGVGAKAELLQRMCRSVLAVDLRGYGQSTPILPSEASAYADAAGAWQYLRMLEPRANRRLIYGHSLGGAVAIELASQVDDAAGLIVEASFTSVEAMGQHLVSRSVPIDLPLKTFVTQRFDSLAKISNIRMPVLIVHGKADGFIPVRQAEDLYQAAPLPKRLFLADQGDHTNIARVAFEEYRRVLQDFFPAVRANATVLERLRPRSRN